jgi:hypothetical protein
VRDGIADPFDLANQLHEPRIFLLASFGALESGRSKSDQTVIIEHVRLHFSVSKINWDVIGESSRIVIRNSTPAEEKECNFGDHQFCPTLEMSHGSGWREACASTTRDRR